MTICSVSVKALSKSNGLNVVRDSYWYRSAKVVRIGRCADVNSLRQSKKRCCCCSVSAGCCVDHGLRHRLDHPAPAEPGQAVDLCELHHSGSGRFVQQAHSRLSEQDHGVQPRGAAEGRAAAARRAAAHRVQPPLVLRRPRPLGRAGRGHAAERRAHALVAGGARHLLHQRAALRLLRAGQVRAGGARRRRAPARHGLLRGAAARGRLGAHLPRGPRQRAAGAPALQVGRGPPRGRQRGAGPRAARAARVARGHGARAAQRRALPPARRTAPHAGRGRAHPPARAAGQVEVGQRVGGGDAARHHRAHPGRAAQAARPHARAHGAARRQRRAPPQGRLGAGRHALIHTAARDANFSIINIDMTLFIRNYFI